MDIYFIQEAHSAADQGKNWRSEWGGTIFSEMGLTVPEVRGHTHFTGFDIAVTDLYLDSLGHFIIIDVKLQNTPFNVVNIYAPNSEAKQVGFYHHLRKKHDT